ncbi:MAG: MBL fold metallo-hydrolase [Chloroflexota bacterium]
MTLCTKKIHLAILMMFILLLAACVPVAPMPATESGSADDGTMAPAESMTRETGATVTVQDLGDIVIHSYLAPEQIFANNTHIIETANSLVLIDTQFLLPMALDFRTYADSLGKPIERLVITHEHPDHFLGSEVFADVDIYALAEVAAKIEEIGQAEVDEKQAQFGDAIASSYVVPATLEAGTSEIDGVTFEFEVVMNAEAEIQVVTKLPAYGVVAVGDIVYSGLHLILAGNPPTWIEALENLKAESGDYPVVLPGHGASTDPSVYDANIAWLMKASELMGTATSGEEFKAGLVEAFPELGLQGAIDFVVPLLFPEGEPEASEEDDSMINLTIKNTIQGAFTDNAEAPYGNDTTMPLAMGEALVFDDEETGFVYDIEMADGVMTMAWVSNAENDKLARVIEEGTFDRYYISFDAPIVVDATADESATLVPDIISVSETEIVVQVGPGMQVGPGFDAVIKISTK